MKRILMPVVITMVVVAVMCSCVYAQAGEGKKNPVNAGNTVCPVMGTKVVPGKALTVEHNGKLYNLCCPICVAEFKKNPEKYAYIAEKQMKKK